MITFQADQLIKLDENNTFTRVDTLSESVRFIY